MSASKIENILFQDDLLFCNQWIHLSSTDSTNNYAANQLNQSKLVNGTVILTDFQTKGKGQRGNKWLSGEAENILASIVIYPNFLIPSKQYYLNIITALAIYSYLETQLSDRNIQIKWPNDILVDGKKIAGILIENTYSGSSIKHSIIGFGLNLNQKEFVHLSATSLSNLTNESFNIYEVLKAICANFERYFLMLKNGNYKGLMTQFKSYLLHYNSWSKCEVNHKQTLGMIEDITDDGRILVQLKDGKRELFQHKEIVFQLS